jgi:hypothetical protein
LRSLPLPPSGCSCRREPFVRPPPGLAASRAGWRTDLVVGSAPTTLARANLVSLERQDAPDPSDLSDARRRCESTATGGDDDHDLRKVIVFRLKQLDGADAGPLRARASTGSEPRESRKCPWSRVSSSARDTREKGAVGRGQRKGDHPIR